jgi:hypothetical protein
MLSGKDLFNIKPWTISMARLESFTIWVQWMDLKSQITGRLFIPLTTLLERPTDLLTNARIPYR